MPLDTQMQAALQRLKKIHFVMTRDMTPEQARIRERAMKMFTARNEPEAVAHIEHCHIPGPMGELTMHVIHR